MSPSHPERVRRNYDDKWWEEDMGPVVAPGNYVGPSIAQTVFLLAAFALLAYYYACGGVQ
jgi:hypothetical protein